MSNESEMGFRVNVKWFSHINSTIGVVRMRDEITNELKFYIGNGHGLSEEDDYLEILAWGAKFPVEAGKALFNMNDNE